MSNIDIQKAHNLGTETARTKIGGMEAALRDKYGVKLEWRGNQAEVKGTGVSGTLTVEEKQVRVNIKLGLMLRPMAGKIRDALERGIQKAIDG